MINSDEELHRLASEYVLGTLELTERNEVEQRLPHDAALRDAVAAWEQRLLPLTTLAAPETPSAQLWPRISASLFTPNTVRQAGGWQAWWNSLAFWRVLAGQPEAPAPDSADPRDRLPPALGREVLCLRIEDHYVRVHTPRGSALVLMSLGQAIAGITDVEGLQTHRSWWVARRAVEGVVEDGRNLRLQLSGGLEAPISRARVGELRAQGWLPDSRP